MRRAEIASAKNKPPLYRYGFPITPEFVFRFAARKGFKVDIPPEVREIFDGREVIHFADVTDELLDDDDRWSFLYLSAHVMMFGYLIDKTGFALESGRPFSSEYNDMVSLWSNYTIKEQCRFPQTIKRRLGVLEDEMNLFQDGGARRKAQWWFDWNNDVVRHSMPLHYPSHDLVLQRVDEEL